MDATAAASFAAHGYAVLRQWLDASAVEALRRDLDAARAAHGLDAAALERSDCNVDAIGLASRGRLDAHSPARREDWAFRTLRRAAVGRAAAAASERAVLGNLPAAAAAATGWAAVYLFSEVFVVKPARSRTAFARHRDDAKQLRALGGVESASAFASTWAPLGDTSGANGTLVLESLETGAEAVVDCAVGDVVVFDRAAYHRSGPNLRRKQTV